MAKSTDARRARPRSGTEASSSAAGHKEPSQSISEPQRRFLQLVFDHFHLTGGWPVLSRLQVQLEQADDYFDLDAAARGLDRGLGEGDVSRDIASLTVRGLQYCAGAEREKSDFALVVRLFYLAYRAAGKDGRVSSADLRTSYEMDELRVRKIGRLLDTELLLKGGGNSAEDEWWFSVSGAVPKFRDVGSYEEYLGVVDSLIPPPTQRVAHDSAPFPGLPSILTTGLGRGGPAVTVSVDGLHPAIVESSGALFADGHYSSAVFGAFKAVEEGVRKKSGLLDHGAKLMGEAFGGSQPRLRVRVGRVPGNEPQQQGLRLLLTGAMLAIRNAGAHGPDSDEDPQEAFESLAFASYLMRRLDATRRARPRTSTRSAELSEKQNGVSAIRGGPATE